MKPRTLAEIASACGGELLQGAPEQLVASVTTDTRKLQRGDLFVALKGETFDGHDFAAAACDQGAAAVLVARDLPLSCPRIVVKDTLLAYGKLGALARAESGAKFLAVTGSAGKTSTKDMLGSIVSLYDTALVAEGSENNEIGVPALLLRLTPEHRFCVLELAMRGAGEIAYLARICRPHVGVITNIGEAHVGRLGSREAIAKAKAELLGALPPEGMAVLNADDFFFGLLSQMAPCPVASFGFGERPAEVAFHVWAEDVHLHGVDPTKFVLRHEHHRVSVTLRVPGRHNVANALAAATAALAAGVPLDVVGAGLEAFEGAKMRSQVLQAPGGFTVINDAYNASPTSTPEALKVLAQCGGRKVFVFGDMLELGPASAEAHRRIGRLSAEAGVDWIITIGKDAALAAEEAEALGLQANVVGSVEEALALLQGALEPGDTVLVKASRGMKLEGVVEGLLRG
jgi:UDP-N-acetylmuramoyl-tripeptide--D-alanyl-D-alanine ligase